VHDAEIVAVPGVKADAGAEIAQLHGASMTPTPARL
jgi:hypothetical protein